MTFTFRWATNQDVPQIQQFIIDNFGIDSIQAAPGRFEALFVEHPKGLHVALCLSNDSICGARFFLPIRIAVGSQILDTAFPADTMVAPLFQKQGIGQKFQEMTIERFQVNISNGQSSAHTALYKKLGASVASTFCIAYQVRKPTLQKAIRPMIRDGLAWLLWLGRKRVFSGEQYILTPELASNLIESCSDRLMPEEVGTLIDKDLFAWRYSGSFYTDYSTIHAIYQNNIGLLVYRKSGDGIKITDIFCPAEQMVDFLRVSLKAINQEKITAVFTGTRLEKVFRSAGFLIRPIDAKLVILATNQSLQEELSRRDWAMFSGDADTDLRYFPGTY